MSEYKKEEWILKNRAEKVEEVARMCGVSPILARIILNRGFSNPDEIKKYLCDDLQDVHDPAQMKDMDKGCQIMMEKIRTGKKIRIVSDYDVDGITSNYILYRALQEAGANISYDIPDRVSDGYGLNIRIVKQAYEDGVDTIVTCDNGIAAFPAIEHAKSLGMTVIVTDHHEVPYTILEDGRNEISLVCADAVIDPHRPDCEYPYKDLCGAGVAYKFVRHLYRIMGIEWEDPERYVDILAIGTVCDVMPLTGENRIYVKHGLQMLTKSKNIGICALKHALELDGKDITVYHLGFRIGPCLNSTGRLESAKESVELLLMEDETEALKQARKMAALNEVRKEMTERATKEAMELVKQDMRLIPSEEGIVKKHVGDDAVIILYIPDIHESVVGLVASKIKEAFYRPTLIFTDAENGNGLKGSGRSIQEYHMFEELSKHRELFMRVGGHRMAAGFSIEKGNLEPLRMALNEGETLSAEDLIEKKYIDASIPVTDITEALMDELQKLEPYGTGNERPLFGLLHMGIRRICMVGNEKQYARCTFVTQNGSKISGMVFRGKELLDNIKVWFGDEECDRILKGYENHAMVDILYHPKKNEYNGRVTMQIEPVSIRKSYKEEHK